jgi:hypothetical protein
MSTGRSQRCGHTGEPPQVRVLLLLHSSQIKAIKPHAHDNFKASVEGLAF